MIINIIKYRLRFGWSVFHVVLGLAAVVSNVPVIAWFYFILVGTLYLMAFGTVNRPLVIAATIAYLGAFELLARMTKCSPIIPWEAGKYLFALLAIIGISMSTEKSRLQSLGFWIILLVIPAVFIDVSDRVTYEEIIFNVMGIVNIVLGLIFFSSIKIRKARFFDLLRLTIFPCITILTYTIIKTPDLKDITFSLGAQVVTSGEFGSNQVSTVLGLGFLIMSLSWILDWRITGSRLIDGIIACVFLIQGLFTFSRGGMVSAAASLLIFFYIFFIKGGFRTRIPVSVKRYALPGGKEFQRNGFIFFAKKQNTPIFATHSKVNGIWIGSSVG